MMKLKLQRRGFLLPMGAVVLMFVGATLASGNSIHPMVFESRTSVSTGSVAYSTAAWIAATAAAVVAVTKVGDEVEWTTLIEEHPGNASPAASPAQKAALAHATFDH